LQGLPTGSWQGPVESPYGLHLVIVDARSEDQAPPLDAVRGAVHRAWADQRRIDGNEKFYRALLENYTVKIEKPK
jgi:parvulin-like peptidyl-prolyl isomerase